MPNLLDKSTLQFLTQNENLPSVLTLFRYRDAILDQLLRNFWVGLQSHIQKSIPRKLQGLVLDIDPTVEKMTDKYAGLRYCDAGMDDHDEYIYYFIDHEMWSGKRRVLYGLGWWTESDNLPKTSLTKLPQVIQARQRMVDLGFTPSKHSLGWLELSDLAEESAESFLMNHAFDPQGAYSQIAESFFPMVEETYELMLKANEAIRKAG